MFYRIIFSIIIFTQLISCIDSENQDLTKPDEEESPDQTIPIIDLTVFPHDYNFGLAGLSKTYDEYYSGYWRGSLCGGNAQAIVGLSGSSVELNTLASYMNPTFGEIDSSGLLSFEPREVNWDCDACGEVRPLDISGTIDRALNIGNINFEVACSTGSGTGHQIRNISVDLEFGAAQPSLWSEMYRIESEANNLIDASEQSCAENIQCKIFNIDAQEDLCNIEAKAFSTSVIDEAVLASLEDQYSDYKWLSGNDGFSGTTYCGALYRSVCYSNVCVMEH